MLYTMTGILGLLWLLGFVILLVVAAGTLVNPMQGRNMNKRGSSNFKSAQTVSFDVAQPFNALLANLKDIKLKTKKRIEKWLDTIFKFVWKLTDHNM